MTGKTIIGYSDYNRNQMETGNTGWEIGTPSHEFIITIREYELKGYIVNFETSILRKIFYMFKYKITIQKQNNEE